MKFGCPSKLINIIKQLHDGMMGRVCADGKESDGFEVTAGVKQGCVIEPSLFNLFFAVLLKEPFPTESLNKSNKRPSSERCYLLMTA